MAPTSTAAEQVERHQDAAGSPPVRGRAEQHPAEQVGQEGQGHHRGGQRRGPGLLVDQDGQRDRGHHVPEHGHDVGHEQGPELGRPEHVAVPGPAGAGTGAAAGGLTGAGEVTDQGCPAASIGARDSVSAES